MGCYDVSSLFSFLGGGSWVRVLPFVCCSSCISACCFCGEILFVYFFRENVLFLEMARKNIASYSFSDDIPSFLLVSSFSTGWVIRRREEDLVISSDKIASVFREHIGSLL